jgi:hypothetical protein
MTTKQHAKVALMAAIVAVIVFGIGARSVAQPNRGRGMAQGTSGGSPTSGGGDSHRSAPQNTAYCRIIRYSPDDNSASGIVGVLRVKPIERDAKVIKLIVRDSDSPCVAVGQNMFYAEDVERFAFKGLYLNAQWKPVLISADDRLEKDVLVKLEAADFVVDGVIQEIADDYIVLRCHPANGAIWPHFKEMAETGVGPLRGCPPHELKERSSRLHRKLKLNIDEEVTSFTDSDGRPATYWDYVEGQAVEATIVFGRKEGILLNLKATEVQEERDQS